MIKEFDKVISSNPSISIVDAWAAANDPLTDASKKWAIVVNEVNENDTLSYFTSDDNRHPENRVIWRYAYVTKQIRSSEIISGQGSSIPTNISPANVFVDNTISLSNERIGNKLLFNNDKTENSNMENKELIFDSKHSFSFIDNRYSLVSAEPMEMDSSYALDYAKKALNDMDILPNNYVAEIYGVEKTELSNINSSNSSSMIEYKVIFFPAVNGVPVYTDDIKHITISFDSEGITELDYDWIELKSANTSTIQTYQVKSYTQNEVLQNLELRYENCTITSAYIMDAQSQLKLIYEIRDEAGFIIARIDSLSGEEVFLHQENELE